MLVVAFAARDPVAERRHSIGRVQASPLRGGDTEIKAAVVKCHEGAEIACVIVVKAEEDDVERHDWLPPKEDNQRWLLIPEQTPSYTFHLKQRRMGKSTVLSCACAHEMKGASVLSHHGGGLTKQCQA